MTLFEGDIEPTAPEGLVTVARFTDPTEAQMARGMLESASIECFLAGESLRKLMPGAFRVWLQVRLEDETVARELLTQAHEGVNDDLNEQGRLQS